MTESLRSYRLVAFLVSLFVLAGMGSLGLVLAKEITEGLLVAATTSPTTLALGYVLASNWHDRGTRVAAIQATPGAAQPPAATVQVRDSKIEVAGASTK